LITFRHRGNFDKTVSYLTQTKRINYKPILQRYGLIGVEALSKDTPIDSSLTANSWDYEIKITRGGFNLYWTNSNVVDGIPVVILLQYGHGTRSGSFVQGRDFINPAMRPIFDQIAENLWKEVTSL